MILSLSKILLVVVGGLLVVTLTLLKPSQEYGVTVRFKID